MTSVREKALSLEYILCIYYWVYFKKDTNKTQVQVLIDLESEVNAIYPTLVKESGLSIKPIDVKAEKIDGNTLNTYEIVVAAFLVTDKANQAKSFEETFLIANVSPQVVFGMLFLILSAVDVDFLD